MWKELLNKIVFFFKVFIMLLIMLLIVGRYLGFAPMRLDPIPWKELFEDRLGFILIFSFILSLIGVVMESINNKKT